MSSFWDWLMCRSQTDMGGEGVHRIVEGDGKNVTHILLNTLIIVLNRNSS